MKRLLLAVSLALVAAAFADVRKSVTFHWEYPAEELTNVLAFKLYSSTDISVPLTNWTVLTNIVGTVTNITIPIQPGKRFFVMTASNWWGESEFSNVADVPAPPCADLNLKIK